MNASRCARAASLERYQGLLEFVWVIGRGQGRPEAGAANP